MDRTLTNAVTDHEFLEREKAKLRSRLEQLPEELANPEYVPSIVGALNLKNGLWSLALTRDAAASKTFFEAAAEQWRRHLRKCGSAFNEPQELFDCFSAHHGLFVSSVLAGGRREDHLESFDHAARLLDEGFARWPPVEDRETDSTPLIVQACCIVALAALWRRTPIPRLLAHCRGARVKKEFTKLKESIVNVADDPGPESCAVVRAIFPKALPFAKYRAGLVSIFRLVEVHGVSTVAHDGDLLRGATEMFPAS